MQEFIFYVRLGFHHVMDLGAYDHILFLAALAIPFTFKSWKKVLVLATVFTITHCVSLALSVYEIMQVNISWIEFLIPLTILFTALFNVRYYRKDGTFGALVLHLLATAFFGLIHGFGFSNYFNMLMAEEVDKIVPLLGFALGIEISQLLIILLALSITGLAYFKFGVKKGHWVAVCSIIIALITIPMLLNTFPT